MNPGSYSYLLIFDGNTPQLAVITKSVGSFFEFEWHHDGRRHKSILPRHPSAAFVDLEIFDQKQVFGYLNQNVSLQRLQSALGGFKLLANI